MRSFLTAACAAFALLAVAGCVQHRAAPSIDAHPNLIVVREFGASPGVITLDQSLGYSLHHGEPGVPPERRAEAVGRAAAFSLADAITQQLTQAGYDAVHLDADTPDPGGHSLLVNGSFVGIVEGHRHEGASVNVLAEVDYRTTASALQQLASFPMDSRRLTDQGLTPAAGRLGPDVNYQATRVGDAIGRYVADLARTNHWSGAGR